MKITAIRLFQLEGVMDYEGEFWEKRLVRAIDIYPGHRVRGASRLPGIPDKRGRCFAIFDILRSMRTSSH